MDVELSEAELAERRKTFKPKPAGFKTGRWRVMPRMSARRVMVP